MDATSFVTPLTRGDLENIKVAMLGELHSVAKMVADRLLSHLQRAGEMQRTAAGNLANNKAGLCATATPRFSGSSASISTVPELDFDSGSSYASSCSSFCPAAATAVTSTAAAATPVALPPAPQRQRHRHHPHDPRDAPLLTCEGLEHLMAQRLALDPQLLLRWECELERRLTAQTPTPGSTPLLSTGATGTPLSSCPTSPLIGGPPPAPRGRSRLSSGVDPAISPPPCHYHRQGTAASGGGDGGAGSPSSCDCCSSYSFLPTRLRSPQPSSGGGCVEAVGLSAPPSSSSSSYATQPYCVAARCEGEEAQVGSPPEPIWRLGAPADASDGDSSMAAAAAAAGAAAPGKAAPSGVQWALRMSAASAEADETPPVPAADLSASAAASSSLSLSLSAAAVAVADNVWGPTGLRRELPQQQVQEIVRQLAVAQAAGRGGRVSAGAAGAAAAVATSAHCVTAPYTLETTTPAAAYAPVAIAPGAAVSISYRPSYLPDRQARQRTQPQPQPQPSQVQELTRGLSPQLWRNGIAGSLCGGSIYATGGADAGGRSSCRGGPAGSAAAAVPAPALTSAVMQPRGVAVPVPAAVTSYGLDLTRVRRADAAGGGGGGDSVGGAPSSVLSFPTSASRASSNSSVAYPGSSDSPHASSSSAATSCCLSLAHPAASPISRGACGVVAASSCSWSASSAES